MIDQWDTRGLMGCTVTRVHIGEEEEERTRCLPTLYFPLRRPLFLCYRETRINTYTPYRSRW